MWSLETLKKINAEREEFLLRKKAEKEAIRKSVKDLKTSNKGR